MKNNKSIYLMAKYVAVPKHKDQTYKIGYMKDPSNTILEEQVYISRTIRNKDLQNNVIIDLTKQTIIKQNNFNSGTTFDSILEYFYNGYGKYITDSIAQLTQ